MKPKTPLVSVLLSTRNRAKQLARLLCSLDSQILEGLRCEVIVVNNGSVDDTTSLLKRSWSGFELRPLYESAASKSRALNRALEIACGDLWAFTDDDVTACPRWLCSLYRAFLAYESAAAFCGPITPRFPSGTPHWMRHHPFADAIFARFEPHLSEGPLPAGVLPFGPNFAVRPSAIHGMRFRLDLGPSADGPHFGDDTDFLQRLRARSGEFIYIPEAQVNHHIERSRVEVRSLMERSFLFGRSTVAMRRKPNYVHLQRGYAVGIVDRDLAHRVERGGLINYYLGQCFQLNLYGESSVDAGLRDALGQLEVQSCSELLSKPAQDFYMANFEVKC